MNVRRFYDYLTRTRRDLFAVLEAAPDEVLAAPAIPGQRFHCIKDLLVHIAAVEDSWLNEDIRRAEPVWKDIPAVARSQDGPHYAGMPLAEIREFWLRVEARTEEYLSTLDEAELSRMVSLHDDDSTVLGVEEILWHVLQHEVRHTAQVTLLLRQAGYPPPQLDLLFYLQELAVEE